MDPASSLAVIGWLVKELINKGITLAIDHWRGAGAGPDLPEALEKLREAFNNVQALLHNARNIRRENKGLLDSVKGLKDAAYDAEDILSELDYYRLQKEVEGNNSSFCSSIKAAGRSMIAAGLRAFSQILCKDTSSPPPSVFDKKNIIRRISEVVSRLDRIIPDVREALRDLKPEERDADSHVSTSHRVTTSTVSSKQIVIGRQDTKAHIIGLLLNGQPPAAAVSDVRVLPIIGAGGIGKTTLARDVYNDKQVVEHFDCTLWLYISANFDVSKLTRHMLELLRVKGSENITNLEQMQTLLKETLCSKKFLLVMDDVWNDADSQKWKTLVGPLESGKTGSRILLTTRLDTVVKMVGKEAMNVFGCPVELKGLPRKEYLSLFNKYAFGDEEPGDHSNLADIGKQIAGKLDGSPLAAKTVGSLLNEKLDVGHWESIRSSGIWERRQSQHDIIPVLKLSYQHLSVHLQQCFAYCCVFPKGCHFKASELVRMWIAHGYIDTETSGNERMEDIGWEYYKILLARSFLEDAYGDFFVHDLFHDLAQSVSADESFIIDTNNQKVRSRVRHLSLSYNHITLVLQKSYLRNLRTLIMFKGREPTNYHALNELLNELKSVRVIYIEWLDFEPGPHNIGHLIHLCYLHFRNFVERKFTDSLCRLYQLQYVKVAEKILHLHGIEKLTCLRELDCFIIEEGRKIGELKNLKQLGGSLTLESLENVKTNEEALEAELSKKMHIRNLRLKWNDSLTLPLLKVAEEPAYIKKVEEVFEGIRPPDYIKMLFIDGYGGVYTPTWMVCFSNLESLFLLNCLKWKDVPPLGELPSLRHLTICKADAVEVIGRGFYGTGVARGFSRLETLELICMPQLVTWSGIGEDSGFLFPRLGKLFIADCPKLEQVPVKELTSLKKVTLSSCNKLHLLPLLPAMLEVLVLHNLELLTDLTMEKLSDLTSLQKLYIKRCPHLNSLPLLPASLKILEVNECPKLPRERYQEGGEDWNNVSHIPEMKWYQEYTQTLALAQDRAEDLELAQLLVHMLEDTQARALALARSLARALVQVRAQKLAHTQARALARTRALARSLARALVQVRAQKLALTLVREREREREWVLERHREGEWELEWEMDWALELELERMRLLM